MTGVQVHRGHDSSCSCSGSPVPPTDIAVLPDAVILAEAGHPIFVSQTRTSKEHRLTRSLTNYRWYLPKANSKC